MFYLKVLVTFALFCVALCDPTNTIKPCKKDDEACMTASAKAILSTFANGFPEYGVDVTDPLHLEEIIGDLSSLKYKFTESTAKGLKNCDIHDVRMNLEKSTLHFELTCKDIVLVGHYTIAGRLFLLPVEGDGDYEINIKTYKFKIDADMKEVKGNDGKTHIYLKKYKFESSPQDKIVYDFKNLFNGQKELDIVDNDGSETVIRFANENWKEVADFVQEPVVAAIAKKLIKNINRYFKLIPIDEMLLD